MSLVGDTVEVCAGNAFLYVGLDYEFSFENIFHLFQFFSRLKIVTWYAGGNLLTIESDH